MEQNEWSKESKYVYIYIFYICSGPFRVGIWIGRA